MRRPRPPDFLAERLAALLRSNSALHSYAVELGIVDEDWLANPKAGPPPVPPVETMRRFMERAVERSPSSLNALGLNALQLMSWDVAWNRFAVRGSTEAVVSVLFIDLQGFTQFTAEHGDAEAMELLTKHNRSVGPVVRRFDGMTVKHIGDGMMIVFKDPAKAIRAGLALVQDDHPLPLRAGAHTGSAIVTDNDVFGNVVNIASRVAGQADGGEFLISGDLYELGAAKTDLTFTGPREVSLKGIDQPVQIWLVES
ncbi:MAG: adenylate/guanylate cyclase domain-containing protein [Nocardiaceae bacterium]|nr:adenylate/guanylate cyclase domain-containing protein [Nocardiaceae bacterium]